MWTGDAMQRVQMDMFFLPAEERLTDPGVMTRSAEVYPELVESGFNIDSLILAGPFLSGHLRSGDAILS